jgi:hypothetical protein
MQGSASAIPTDESAIHVEDVNGRLGPGVEKLAAAVKRDKENARSVASTAASLANVGPKLLAEVLPNATAVPTGSPVRVHAHDATAATASATNRSPPLGAMRDNRRPASSSGRASSPPLSGVTGGSRRGGSAATAAAAAVAPAARLRVSDATRQPSPAASRATSAQAAKRRKPENPIGHMSSGVVVPVVPPAKGQRAVAQETNGTRHSAAAASTAQRDAGSAAQLHESEAMSSLTKPGEVVPFSTRCVVAGNPLRLG